MKPLWIIAAIATIAGLAFLFARFAILDVEPSESGAIGHDAPGEAELVATPSNPDELAPSPQRAEIDPANADSHDAILRLTFRMPDGTPVTGGTVTLGQGSGDRIVTTPDWIDEAGCWQGSAWAGVDFIEWSPTRVGSDRWYGFASGRKLLEPPFDPKGENRTIDIVVDPGRILTGTVIDRATGQALSDAFVAIPDVVPSRSFGTHTGSDGRFRLAGLDDATFALDQPFEVTATHRDYPAAKQAIDWRAAGPVADVVIAMDRGVIVLGTVVDALGSPRGGITIELAIGAGSRDEPRPYQWLVGARSNELGQFAFPVVPSGSVAELRYGPLEQVHVEDIRQRAYVDVSLTVEAAETVTVRAIDPLGARVDEFSLFARAANGRPLWQPTRRRSFDARAGDVVDVVVFAEGESRTQWLRGERRIVVTSGLDPIEVRMTSVHIEPRTRDDPSLSVTAYEGVRNRFDAWAFGSTFKLDVRRDDGAPYTGRFRVDQPSGSSSTNVLDDGRLWLSLPPGRHRLRITTEGFAPRVLELESAESGFVPLPVELHR